MELLEYVFMPGRLESICCCSCCICRMGDVLPASAYEAATAEGKEKIRVDRQKQLAAMPRGKVTQNFLANIAEKALQLREATEDLLIMLGELPESEVKGRAIQAARKQLELHVKQGNMLAVAAEEGMELAQELFEPVCKLGELDDETTKALKELKKRKEAEKKKEESAARSSSWKSSGVKRSTPYYYSSSYGSGGAGNWALQQVLAQQLLQQQGGGRNYSGKTSGKSAAASAGSSVGASSSDPGYAARMAAGKMVYPCHGCGVVGHWKKDGDCKPADIAAHIKKKMEERKKLEAEEGSKRKSEISLWPKSKFVHPSR